MVFPCAPAMAIPYLRRISSASISARGITGTCRSLAAATSGLSSLTAEDMTTTSAPSMFEDACPMNIFAPKDSSLLVVSVSLRSEPPILYPRFIRTSAIPLIPTPPMPTKCILWYFLYMKTPLCRRSLFAYSQHLGRGLRLSKGFRALFHLQKGFYIQEQSLYLARQPLARRLGIQHHYGRPGVLQFARVDLLMVIRGEWIRYEDGRLAKRCDLRDRERPGAADYKVRARVCRRHVVYIGHYARR